jgi:phosphoribosylcarboxyaminoimidazole (NCAIR) mutase
VQSPANGDARGGGVPPHGLRYRRSMKAKDWLAAALFVIVSAAAVAALMIGMAHAHTHRHAVLSPVQRQNLASCYQNLGNGGC